MIKGKTKKPSKQRKRVYKASTHLRAKMMAAHLSQELKEKYNKRSLSIRVGDTVKIMRGDFSGIEGKISEVDKGSYRVFIDGVTREKVSGETVNVPINTSNLLLTKLDLDDKWRSKILDRAKVTVKR
jgi:large subunit ribosomal protein L24